MCATCANRHENSTQYAIQKRSIGMHLHTPMYQCCHDNNANLAKTQQCLLAAYQPLIDLNSIQ